LRNLSIWLCWKKVVDTATGKVRKVPLYASGMQRHGKQGSADDRARLVTYSRALKACKSLGADGIGIAILPDSDVSVIDFDNCVSDSEIHSAVLAACQESYAELSPSGAGVHLFIRGSLGHNLKCLATESLFGVEVFSSAGFVTFTGNTLPDWSLWGYDELIGEPNAALTAILRERFSKDHAGNRPAAEGSDPIDAIASTTTAETLADLQSAMPLLAEKRASDRQLWVNVGQALKDLARRGYPLEANELWHAHSARDSRYTRDESEYLWGTFNPSALTLASILYWAKEDGGWVSTRKGERESCDSFYAYLPSHTYLHIATRALWPAASVNNNVTDWPANPVTGKAMKPSGYLDAHRAVQQMTWHPAEGQLVLDRVMHEGGWVTQKGMRVFNLYRAPSPMPGDATKAERWLDHLRRVYPEDADHIIRWFAHRVQRPGEKINHALVLGGDMGIGKDSILVPVVHAIGSWNAQEINPNQLVGRFNGWVKAVLVRVSEARDQGEVNRFQFYEHCKTLIVTPPDVLRVDEKNIKEHYIPNVLGLVITTNHRSDGLYLPADDRRHYVAWSDRKIGDFSKDYWTGLHSWFATEGNGHVAAYLRNVDLSGFDPKAPPKKTAAFWVLVQSGEAPENNELRDLIDLLPNKRAFTISDLAEMGGMHPDHVDICAELVNRSNRRTVPHKMGRVGYVIVRNPDAAEGQWLIRGRRQRVYSLADLTYSQQVEAARALQRQ